MPTTAALFLGAIAAWAVPMMLWWNIAGRADETRRTRAARHRPEPTPASPADPASPANAHPSVEWADPARIWTALNAENTLLTALLTGLIPRDDYRARMSELARRCEPAQPTKGDE
ncbi:hypothetical protein GPX89_13905 [Nocardia sp. ET3-3]|uniref:Uncharacterized protein n=1 Tax=Nocardia terrae TaxID=2675851 RepID=A0A7K1UVH9_9NOCA|nr:hypothetical protein [Nocardia terrae]MVU78335.1 hypothetical protein [Nocardia terrae]